MPRAPHHGCNTSAQKLSLRFSSWIDYINASLVPYKTKKVFGRSTASCVLCALPIASLVLTLHQPSHKFFWTCPHAFLFSGPHHVATHASHFYEPRAPDSKFFMSDLTRITLGLIRSHTRHIDHTSRIFFLFLYTRHTSIDCIDPSHAHHDRKKFFDRGSESHHESIELMARVTTPHVVLRILMSWSSQKNSS